MERKNGKMKTLFRLALLMGALAFLGNNLGPAEAQGLPRYDMRLEQPLVRGHGPRALTNSQAWRKLYTPAMQVHWNPATGLPRHLFVYGKTLTGPLTDPPEKAARNFLSRNQGLLRLTTENIQSLRLSKQAVSPRSGVTHLTLHQYHQDLPVFGNDFRFHFTADGRLLSVGLNYQSLPPMKLTPQISAAQALSAVAANVTGQVGFQPKVTQAEPGAIRRTIFEAGPFLQTHAASLVIFPTRTGARLGWRVLFHKDSDERYLAIVDAKKGGLLLRINMVNTYSGLVFDEHPDAGPQNWRSFDGDPIASPAGWVDPRQSETRGNNVRAQADWLDSNGGGVRPPHDGSQAFNYPFTNAWENTADFWADWQAAVTNLFCHNNLYHDYLYHLGFDEASGNFQVDNFGRGGFGGDPVEADAQDGAGIGNVNNANFYTPPDGGHPLEWGVPRMQMYLFAPPFPFHDASFDADVMLHEYVHGLSNRLIGSLEDPFSLFDVQSGAMGEGWSDFYPCNFFDDPVMGEYSTGNSATGIRNYALDANPLLYNNIGYDGGPEVHSDGEIWAATLWDIRTRLVNAYGLEGGIELAALLITEGMKFTPGHPSFLDARDGILLADGALTGGANQGRIWTAFRGRGMGYDASTLGEWDDSPIAGNAPPPAKGAINGRAYWQEQELIAVESDHPYANDSDLTWPLVVPGASALRVRFPWYEIEFDWDFVYIEDGFGTPYDALTGLEFGRWSAWVPGDTLVIHLVSDEIETGLGFIADLLQVQHPAKRVPIDLSTGISRNTNNDGNYQFANRAPGSYTVMAPWIFQPFTQNAPVAKGITTVVDFVAHALWGVSFLQVTPSVGDSATVFKFEANYLHLKNLAPGTKKLRVYEENGAFVGAKNMTTTDTTYRDGSVFKATRRLTEGATYQFTGRFRASGETRDFGPQYGPTVLSNAKLTQAKVTPGTGTADSTWFTFAVKYTQAENYAPEYVKVKVFHAGGGFFKTLKMTTTDTSYDDGSVFKKRVRLPAGDYEYRFVAQQVDRVFQTVKKPGPSVQ